LVCYQTFVGVAESVTYRFDERAKSQRKPKQDWYSTQGLPSRPATPSLEENLTSRLLIGEAAGLSNLNQSAKYGIAHQDSHSLGFRSLDSPVKRQRRGVRDPPLRITNAKSG
jgi:hypothetical protein